LEYEHKLVSTISVIHKSLIFPVKNHHENSPKLCIGNQRNKVPGSAFSNHLVMKCVRVCMCIRMHLSKFIRALYDAM